jgi:tetratricopeptide (TPR) repeat protein
VQRRSQVIFGVFAFVLAASLVASLVLPILFDALTDDDGSRGDPESIDASVEEALRKTAEAGGNDPYAFVGLASYLANTGRLSEAIPWYERAIDMAPDDAVVRLNFARSLAAGGMRQDAELQFQRSLELDPESPQTHFYLAELYDTWMPPRLNDAIDHYERTIETGPDTFVAERARERLSTLLGESATPAATAISEE